MLRSALIGGTIGDLIIIYVVNTDIILIPFFCPHLRI